MLPCRIRPPILDLSVDRFAAFHTWKEKWQDYVLLSDLATKDNSYQAAMLRYTFSSETRNIYESFNLSNVEKNDPAIIIAKVEEFARGIVNETLERHKFFKRLQEEGECFDDFLTEVKLLSKNCNFCNTDDCFGSLLRDRIVSGISRDDVREKLLAEKTLTLDKAVEICRSMEKAQEGVTELRKVGNSDVDRIGYYQSRYSKNIQQQPGGSAANDGKRDNLILKCKFCSKQHKFGRNSCPAWGKKCHDCGEMNHFGKSTMCRNPQRDGASTPTKRGERDHLAGALFIGSAETELMQIDKVQSDKDGDKWEIELSAKFGRIRFKIDTGAEVSVINTNQLKQWGVKINQLRQPEKSLLGPDGTKLKCHGFLKQFVTVGNKTAPIIMYVCDNIKTPLLGRPALETFDLVKVGIPANATCSFVTEKREEVQHEIMRNFPHVFEGLGTIKGKPINITLEDDVVPYHIGAPRRIAIPLLEPLREELERMKKMGVIRPIDEPTDWCHPIVLVEKPNGDIRICLDLTQLNKGTKREFYELPSVDDTLSQLGTRCNFMAKLDANSGYWQLPMEKESQLKCTFTTPFGRFCPTRGPFGLRFSTRNLQ